MKRVAEVTARIRPHGFFVVETKSKSSYRATPRHAACLMYALMTDAPANSTPDVLKEAEGIWTAGCSQDGCDMLGKLFNGKMLNLFNPHNVIDGMATIIEMASIDPELFNFIFIEPLNDGVFEISNYRFCKFLIPLNLDRINFKCGTSAERNNKESGVLYNFINVNYEGEVIFLKMEKLTRVLLDVFLDVGRVFSGSCTEGSHENA